MFYRKETRSTNQNSINDIRYHNIDLRNSILISVWLYGSEWLITQMSKTD